MSAEDIAASALAGLNKISSSSSCSEVVGGSSYRERESTATSITEGLLLAAATEASSSSIKPQKPSTVVTKAPAKPSKMSTNNKKNKGKKAKEEFKFPVEPRTIQVVKKPRTYMNHSYRDFSSVPPELDDEFPTEISQMTFPQKVHHILSQPEYSRFISWQSHGRAFRISIPKMFETKVCPKYLNHTRYSSFLRQLSNFGFKHITQGRDRNCYYHEFMLRGLPHLCKYMPKPKDARRLIPDPQNEPDFYAISQLYPLPDDKEYREKEAAKPAPENEMPEAGMPRFASDLIGLANEGLPPAKRSRTVAPEPTTNMTTTTPATVNATASSAAPDLSTKNAVDFLNKLVNPTRASHDILGRNPGSASLPASSASSLTSATASLAAAANGLPVGDALAAFRAPQMQAAVDRNSAVLAALRANAMSTRRHHHHHHPAPTTVVSPSTRNDPAATLAAALLRQANGGGGLRRSNNNPLGGFFGPRF